MTDAGGPLFSVLIPSRNRVDLLRRAVISVLRQDFHDFEIVVADNCSDEDYRAALACFDDPRLRLVRSPAPRPVGENWRLALAQARGSYVVMLGDDDALLRVSLRAAHRIAAEFASPELIYAPACHYAYPGATPAAPDGYFLVVKNSPLFEDAAEPYRLDPERGAALARKAFGFRHRISFNAQHFVWRRDLLDRMAADAGVFADPYPDYFTAVLSFLTARTIVVTPSPLAVIGIAPRSFGAHRAAGRETEGLEMLGVEGLALDDAVAADPEAAAALAEPGSGHYRNWLITLLRLRAASPLCRDAPIDWRAYRRIQIVHQAAAAASGRGRFLREARARLDPADLRFARRLLRYDLWERMMGRFDPVQTAARQVVALGVYHPAVTRPAAARPCADILEAVDAYAPEAGAL